MKKKYLSLILIVFISFFIKSCFEFPGTSCRGKEENFGVVLLNEESHLIFSKNEIPANHTFVNINGDKRRYTRSKYAQEKYNGTRLICEDGDQLRYAYITGERRLVEYTSTSNHSYKYGITTHLVKDKNDDFLVVDTFFFAGRFVFIPSFKENDSTEIFSIGASVGTQPVPIGVPIPEFHEDTTILGKSFYNVHHSTEHNDLLFSEGVGAVAIYHKNELWVLDE